MTARPISSAGKLHVLDLAHLKARLGEKWPRMSGHVERFFEIAIGRSLGPGDTSMRLDELSYLLLFRNLTPEEAQIKCCNISEEVCQRLFGEQGAQVSLRNLVADVKISAPLPRGDELRDMMDAKLERDGKETIVTRQPATRAEAANEREPVLSLRFVHDGRVLHKIPARDIGYLYRPVWDAIKQVVAIYLCQAMLRSQTSADEVEGFCIGADEAAQATLDFLTLEECADRIRRLRASGLRVFMALPVGFATLARSYRWTTYSETRRRLPGDVSRDIASVVFLDPGVPHIKLSQELPKLAHLTHNVFCVTDDADGAGARFARTGTRAVGISIVPSDPEEKSIARIKRLAQKTRDAGLDAFVLGLRTTSLAIHAMSVGIRYMEGPIVRPATGDPRHAYAQSVEYLYQSKLMPESRSPAIDSS